MTHRRHERDPRRARGRESTSPLAARIGGIALRAAALVAFVTAPLSAQDPAPRVVVGSKTFTESVILGEIVAALARDAGAEVEHRRGLGGTEILWSALLAGDVDVYVDYTGTLRRQVLHLDEDASLAAALREHGIAATAPIGFNNTYALGMAEARAAALDVRALSDLARHPELRFGFSHEFMNRPDGWPGVRAAYALPQDDVRGLEHELAYRGIVAGDIDVTDLYSTDADLLYYDLRALDDDRAFFPAYHAVALVRDDVPRGIVSALRRLEGRIDDDEMTALNARVKLDGETESAVAADFVRARLGVAAVASDEGRAGRILGRTGEHLVLVGISMIAAVAVAVPLGIVAARRRRLGQAILAVVGVLQTIPSLALLVFVIPLLGIGGVPAVVALFLYSLLPIVRNTASGLRDIPAPLLESAEALGLPAAARLRLVELPLASPSMLAGIKTAVIINIGTATLGAFIGAGGYGQPILTGIRLDDLSLVFEGAVPAAAMALAAQTLFEGIERLVVPRGLRLRTT